VIRICLIVQITAASDLCCMAGSSELEGLFSISLSDVNHFMKFSHLVNSDRRLFVHLLRRRFYVRHTFGRIEWHSCDCLATGG
jgi:hypothetical protein